MASPDQKPEQKPVAQVAVQANPPVPSAQPAPPVDHAEDDDDDEIERTLTAEEAAKAFAHAHSKARKPPTHVRIKTQLIHSGKRYRPGDVESKPTNHLMALATEGRLAEHVERGTKSNPEAVKWVKPSFVAPPPPLMPQLDPTLPQ